jgi:hypothetical protein
MTMEVPDPVRWTTYVQTFAVIASTIGTFVYVYFTYHIIFRAKVSFPLTDRPLHDRGGGAAPVEDRRALGCDETEDANDIALG